MKTKDQKLKGLLKANAGFSFLSGLSLNIFSVDLAKLFDVMQSIIFQFIGIGLIVFAVFVFFQSLRKEANKKLVQLIIYLDWGWVIASAIVISGLLIPINFIGGILIITVAVIVGIFAFLQRRNL